MESSYKATKEFKYYSNIFSYTVGASKTGHPAPFPDKLAEDQILSWSNEMILFLIRLWVVEQPH